MNNEPVAWTDGKGNYFDKNSFFPVDDLIPLYTHPAKTLTDEEIYQLGMELGMYEYGYEQNPSGNCLNFARAILRKAQK
jgi:hypothetical protein